MEFYGRVNRSQDTHDMIWLDAEFQNYEFRTGGRGRYGMNAAQVFSEHEPSQDYRSRSFWGRGYDRAGPSNHQSFSRENDIENFLLRCGVQKPTLKRLPKVLLHLMETEYCGVCAYAFDNFDGARLHYISKNHNKNLKKWLDQQAKVGSMRPKEIPLRARDLYCELCDIHITSKAHADSHYAGKPHRAIVEGRKIPKNPFLLQKNMQNRVEQLIRREKKSLKPTEKSAASEIAKTVNSSIPPELYCDICKASVTCTEEMTRHLNGKKHLSNEKRHIFNIMKGGTTIPKPAEPAATATAKAIPDEPATTATAKAIPDEPAATATAKAIAVEPAANATAKDTGAQSADAWEKWETNCHEDEFDWGHGSGTWDDDPQ